MINVQDEYRGLLSGVLHGGAQTLGHGLSTEEYLDMIWLEVSHY
jgi:hypothetical protein